MANMKGKLGRVLAAAVVVASALAAGCGRGGATAPVAAGLAQRTAQVRGVNPAALRSRFKPRPVVGTMWTRGQATNMVGVEEEGGLAPLPKPTPTPGVPKPPAPPPADEIDELVGNLREFGYRGDRAGVISAVRSAVTQYPVNTPETPFGWDPSINVKQHYEWWKPSFPVGDQPSFPEYQEQSLMVAQHKFDVVYYIWVSKQEDPANQPGAPVGGGPWVDFNKEIPVVKAIGRDGWMVNLSTKGTIVDYFKMPEEYISPIDYNHLLEVPRKLYY